MEAALPGPAGTSSSRVALAKLHAFQASRRLALTKTRACRRADAYVALTERVSAAAVRVLR